MFGSNKRPVAGQVDSLIGAQSQVDGDISFDGGLFVDGVIRGNIRAESDRSILTLTEKGAIAGEVRVPHIILNGTVKGNVYATERVELQANAKVEGDVYYRLIEMAMGAEVNGRLVRLADGSELPAIGSSQAALAHTRALDAGPGSDE